MDLSNVYLGDIRTEIKQYLSVDRKNVVWTEIYHIETGECLGAVNGVKDARTALTTLKRAVCQEVAA